MKFYIIMNKLIDLFDKPEPWIIELNNRSWYNEPILGVDNKYYYIYCWVNMDTQWCYVGMHKSNNAFNEEGYLGSCYNEHYWNSRKVHEYNLVILSYEENIQSLRLLESLIIDEYMISTYSEKGLFNINPGGKGGFNAAFKRLVELYPSTNGIPTEWIESCHKSVIKTCKERYPLTNGLPYKLRDLNNNKEWTKNRSKNTGLTVKYKTINKYIDLLISKNLELNLYNYKEHTPARYNGYRNYKNHISSLEDLYLTERWNSNMELIFGELIFK